MKRKSARSLEDTASQIDFLEMPDEEMTLLEPAENEVELLEVEPVESLTDKRVIEKNNVLSLVVGEQTSTTRRASSNVDSRIDSVLAGLIEQRMQTKALPLALRKRLMYQRAISA